MVGALLVALLSDGRGAVWVLSSQVVGVLSGCSPSSPVVGGGGVLLLFPLVPPLVITSLFPRLAVGVILTGCLGALLSGGRGALLVASLSEERGGCGVLLSLFPLVPPLVITSLFPRIAVGVILTGCLGALLSEERGGCGAGVGLHAIGAAAVAGCPGWDARASRAYIRTRTYAPARAGA